jgi:hypothetical protein
MLRGVYDAGMNDVWSGHRRARGPGSCMGLIAEFSAPGQVTGSQCSRRGGFCLVGWSREATPNRVKTERTAFSARS